MSLQSRTAERAAVLFQQGEFRLVRIGPWSAIHVINPEGTGGPSVHTVTCRDGGLWCNCPYRLKKLGDRPIPCKHEAAAALWWKAEMEKGDEEARRAEVMARAERIRKELFD